MLDVRQVRGAVDGDEFGAWKGRAHRLAHGEGHRAVRSTPEDENRHADARVPHMGWNEIVPRNGARLLRNLPPHPYLYFAHSYYAPVIDATAATCEYAVPYTAVLEAGNIFGVQFHPEKSGPIGLRIVRNFVEL